MRHERFQPERLASGLIGAVEMEEKFARLARHSSFLGDLDPGHPLKDPGLTAVERVTEGEFALQEEMSSLGWIANLKHDISDPSVIPEVVFKHPIKFFNLVRTFKQKMDRLEKILVDMALSKSTLLILGDMSGDASRGRTVDELKEDSENLLRAHGETFDKIFAGLVTVPHFTDGTEEHAATVANLHALAVAAVEYEQG